MSFIPLLLLLQWACVGGHIAPSTFQFTRVVPYTGPGPGGWKAAQVIVLLGKLSARFPSTATCEIEVGVPEVNINGRVADAFAQQASALAADKAARIVLREWQPTAVLCNQFRAHMQEALGDPISGSILGAKVTGFLSMGIPRTTFP